MSDRSPISAEAAEQLLKDAFRGDPSRIEPLEPGLILLDGIFDVDDLKKIVTILERVVS